MRDGWHTLQGYVVYIENNKVLRGIKRDHNNQEIPAFPFRQIDAHTWSNCSGISAPAFIAGARRGTIALK